MELKTIFKADQSAFGIVEMCFGTTGEAGKDGSFNKGTGTVISIATDGCYPIEIIGTNRNFGGEFSDENPMRVYGFDCVLLKFQGLEGYDSLLKCFRQIVKEAELSGYLQAEEPGDDE